LFCHCPASANAIVLRCLPRFATCIGREETMIGFVIIVTAFFSGAAVTVLAVVSIGSRREDRAATLHGAPPGPVAAAARRIIGLYVRTPGRPADQQAEASQQAGSSQYARAGESSGVPGAGLADVLQ
jgi:hypothetical protein